MGLTGQQMQSLPQNSHQEWRKLGNSTRRYFRQKAREVSRPVQSSQTSQTVGSRVSHSPAMHSWSLYVFISQNPGLLTTLFSSQNPRSVFVLTFSREMQTNTENVNIINHSCQSGCRYQGYIEKIATATFNLKAKNRFSSTNDEIRNKTRERELIPRNV